MAKTGLEREGGTRPETRGELSASMRDTIGTQARRIEALETDKAKALEVLRLGFQYESIEDACRQRMQAYISECGKVVAAKEILKAVHSVYMR